MSFARAAEALERRERVDESGHTWATYTWTPVAFPPPIGVDVMGWIRGGCAERVYFDGRNWYVTRQRKRVTPTHWTWMLKGPAL